MEELPLWLPLVSNATPRQTSLAWRRQRHRRQGAAACDSRQALPFASGCPLHLKARMCGLQSPCPLPSSLMHLWYCKAAFNMLTYGVA
jgi:hypothetical protein